MELNRYSDIREDLYFDISLGHQGFVAHPHPDDEEAVQDTLSIEIRRFMFEADEEGTKIATIFCHFFDLDQQSIYTEADFLYPLDIISQETFQIGEYLLDHYIDVHSEIDGELTPNILHVFHFNLEESYRGGDVEAGLLRDLGEIVQAVFRKSVEYVTYILTDEDMKSTFENGEHTEVASLPAYANPAYILRS